MSISSQIEGTDLSIEYPDGWELRPKLGTVEEIRIFVDEFPAVAAQFGLRGSDSDEQLLRLWTQLSEDFVEVAWDPRDGDTASLSVSTGTLAPNLVAWRAREKSIAKLYKATLVSAERLMVGEHRAYSSIIQHRKIPVLIGTVVVEQSGGEVLVVSLALDREDRSLAEQIFKSLETV